MSIDLIGFIITFIYCSFSSLHKSYLLDLALYLHNHSNYYFSSSFGSFITILAVATGCDVWQHASEL